MKIFCVGRNYAEHAREMQHAIPEEPVIFLKPSTAYLPNGSVFPMPGFSSQIHYEGELVIRIGKEGKMISEKDAPQYYDGVTVGIDFTARDIQNRCKEKGLPWELAKAFDHSAAVGEFLHFNQLPNPSQILFILVKNGQPVQTGSSGQMIFGINFLISFLSRYFTLETGDLLFTGTPAGVGNIRSGDTYEGIIQDKKLLRISIR